MLRIPGTALLALLVLATGASASSLYVWDTDSGPMMVSVSPWMGIERVVNPPPSGSPPIASPVVPLVPGALVPGYAVPVGTPVISSTGSVVAGASGGPVVPLTSYYPRTDVRGGSSPGLVVSPVIPFGNTPLGPGPVSAASRDALRAVGLAGVTAAPVGVVRVAPPATTLTVEQQVEATALGPGVSLPLLR